MKQVFLIVAVALSATCFSQKVSNKLAFKKGEKLELVSQANSVVTQEAGGQSMEVKVNATITRIFDVEEATANGATIEHKVKRIQFNIEAPMGGAQSFDSENEADMKGEGGKAAEKAIKNKYTMWVDGTGKITNVKSDNNNPNSADAKGEADPMGNMLSQLGDGMDLPKVGDPIDFKILPEREVSKGESWTDSAGTKKSVYTIFDINENDIVITFNENGSTERKQEAMGMEMTISTKDKTTGKIILDRKTGLMKERTETISSEGFMEMMGQSIPTNMQVTKTTTVKKS